MTMKETTTLTGTMADIERLIISNPDYAFSLLDSAEDIKKQFVENSIRGKTIEEISSLACNLFMELQITVIEKAMQTSRAEAMRGMLIISQRETPEEIKRRIIETPEFGKGSAELNRAVRGIERLFDWNANNAAKRMIGKQQTDRSKAGAAKRHEVANQTRETAINCLRAAYDAGHTKPADAVNYCCNQGWFKKTGNRSEHSIDGVLVKLRTLKETYWREVLPIK